jgi:hypothetical protein
MVMKSFGSLWDSTWKRELGSNLETKKFKFGFKDAQFWGHSLFPPSENHDMDDHYGPQLSSKSQHHR